MYTLIRLLPVRRLLAEQLPALATAWIIAELFYKFKSFTLECAAFLVTWAVIDGAVQLVARALAPAQPGLESRP
jgi:hypothetical protein